MKRNRQTADKKNKGKRKGRSLSSKEFNSTMCIFLFLDEMMQCNELNFPNVCFIIIVVLMVVLVKVVVTLV